MIKPKISVIIPTYRRPNLLERSIRSVLSQSYKSITVLVCDNASDDETDKVVQKIISEDYRVKYICQPKNIGAGQNFLYGMKQVKTPFFSLLSDDDFLLPTFFEKAMVGFSSYPCAKFVSTKVLRVDFDNGLVLPPRFFPCGYFKPPEGLDTMVKYGPPTWTGILFRSEIIDEIGLIDLDVGRPCDYEYEYRVASISSYLSLNVVGAVFSISEHSFSSNHERPSIEIHKGQMNICKKMMSEYDISNFQAKRSSKIIKRRYLRILLQNTLGYAIYDKNVSEAEIYITYKDIYGCSGLAFMWFCFSKALKIRLIRKIIELHLRKTREKIGLRKKNISSNAVKEYNKILAVDSEIKKIIGL